MCHLTGPKASVVQPDWPKDILMRVLTESLPRNCLEDLPCPVETDAVSPAFAGREAQRRSEFQPGPLNAGDVAVGLGA